MLSQMCAVLAVTSLVLTGSAVSAAAADEADQGTAWAESFLAAPLESWDAEPVDPQPVALDPTPGMPPEAGDVVAPAWDVAPDMAIGPVPQMLPDPDLDLGAGPAPVQDDSSGGGASPLTPEQERQLRASAEFYLRDGSPFGARAYLVKARHIISGGPPTQDWIDAAKFVGGFVVQTSATVVAIAGCPATSGATCLIATALANAGGACIDGCDGAEVAVNVVAIGLAVKAGYAINSAGLSRTEDIARKLVTDAEAASSSAIAKSTVVSGRFPRTADQHAVLVRRSADGRITNYQVYGADGLPVKRVDVVGKSHGGVDTPHVVEFEKHVNPTTGEVFVRPNSTVRPATSEELIGLE